jgi:hypothetical protein
VLIYLRLGEWRVIKGGANIRQSNDQVTLPHILEGWDDDRRVPAVTLDGLIEAAREVVPIYLSRKWKDTKNSEADLVIVRHEDSPSDDERIKLTTIEASQSTDSMGPRDASSPKHCFHRTRSPKILEKDRIG